MNQKSDIDKSIPHAIQLLGDRPPPNFNKEKFIFILHDSIEVSNVAIGRRAQARQLTKERYNKLVPKANANLKKISTECPCTYILAYRNEINDLRKQVYKYVLDSEAFNARKRGIYKSNSDWNYYYELSIKDIQDNKIFILTDKFFEGDAFKYKKVLGKLYKYLK